MTDSTSAAKAAARLAAALADRYSIERELGQGGMATVYLAQDLKHDRQVAIKVLKPELAAVIGAERFLSEIKTTANLQHPHILALHDSGEVNGTVFYVMPYVEGESLRDRLARERQLSIADAVRITTEVASALDYAHRHGVIHRDIKPENILLHDGQAMVADFGIALAAAKTSGTRMTETGMSLGTPHYMSPEQAMGERHLDARTDIYALGCVLYEMLTGEPPFTGPSAQAIVAKVMTEKPTAPSATRDTVPEAVEDAVLTALAKLPVDRFATAAQFAAVLKKGGSEARREKRDGKRPFSSLVPRLSFLAVVLVLAGIAALGWLRPVPRPVNWSVVGFRDGQSLDVSLGGTHLAISPDGSTIVYSGGAPDRQLWIKTAGALDATPLPGTTGGYDPFFSPDGREIGFTSDHDGRAMKVVSLAGGPPRDLVAGTGTSGGTWSTDGYIYFDADERGLQRIHADGTGLETVMPLDSARREIGIAWPRVLPDNHVALMRLRRANDAPADFEIVATRIGTGERKTVIRAVSAQYLAGYLLFVTVDGTLQASRFDESHLALVGSPNTIATGLRVAGTYAGVDLATSTGGALYYVSGTSGAASRLEWVGLNGAVTPVDSTWHESGDIRSIALSPDERHVAMSLLRAGTTGADIWTKDLPSGPLNRLTRDPAAEGQPSWSADGKFILFLTERVVPTGVVRRRADGTGNDTLLIQSDRSLSEALESPDGRWLVARTNAGQAGSGDILAMQIGKDPALKTLIASAVLEFQPTISPDSRWIAYTSLTSGRYEVFVRPFPEVNSAIWQVSNDGGSEPRWAHSGKSLFFRATTGGLEMMTVDVKTTPTFSHGSPRMLFRTEAAAGLDYARYDLSRDDRRFLMVGRGDAGATTQLVRIENVTEKLRDRKAP